MKPNWTPRDSRHQSFHGSAKMSDPEEKKELTAIPWNPIKREDPLRNSRWQTVDSSVPPTRQTRDDCWSSRPWECRDKRRASFRSLLFASFSSFSFPWFSSIFFLGGGSRFVLATSATSGDTVAICRKGHTHAQKKIKNKKKKRKRWVADLARNSLFAFWTLNSGVEELKGRGEGLFACAGPWSRPSILNRRTKPKRKQRRSGVYSNRRRPRRPKMVSTPAADQYWNGRAKKKTLKKSKRKETFPYAPTSLLKWFELNRVFFGEFFARQE